MPKFDPPIACEIHTQDEIPRLGSGRRRVFVRELGRKWVRLTSVGGKQIKTTRAIWDRVKR